MAATPHAPVETEGSMDCFTDSEGISKLNQGVIREIGSALGQGMIRFAVCEGCQGFPVAGGLTGGFEPVCAGGGAAEFWDAAGAGDQDCGFFLPRFLTNLSVSTIGVRKRGIRRR